MTLQYRNYNLGLLYLLNNWPAMPELQMAINDPVA